MAELNINPIELFGSWMQNKYSEEQITNDLEQQGFIREHITELLHQYKKHKLNIRTKNGFILIAIGSFLGFISCVCTVYEIMPEFRNIILYGLTTLGISMATLGGYLVFE